MGDRVLLTGRLEHAELADLLPACEAQVVPSTFPESFGMVAVEAAACGALPVSADHSGLAEVTRTLAEAVGPPAADWLSFGLGPRSVRDLADCPDRVARRPGAGPWRHQGHAGRNGHRAVFVAGRCQGGAGRRRGSS